MQPTSPAPGRGALVYGLDNVLLELPVAGVGSRTLAVTIDYIVLLFLQTIWIIAGVLVLGTLISGGGLAAVVLAGAFLLQWGYFALFEIVTDGQTPGKLAVGLRVVSHRGGRATVTAFLVRNFLRTLDHVVGLPLMAIDRRARRLGDLVAGTLVVHHREPDAEETGLARHPATWGAREIAVVESFLRRAPHMERAGAQSLAEQLLRWIERREPEFWSEIEPALVASADRVFVLRQALGSPT